MNILSKYLIAGFSLAILVLSFYYLGDIFGYIIVAWIVSMIGTPMVSFLKKFMKKGMAAGITIISFFLGFMLIVWLVIPPVLQQVKHLSEIDFTEVLENIQEPLDDWNNWLEDKGMDINFNDDNIEIQNTLESQTTNTEISFDTLLQQGFLDSNQQAITIVLQVNDQPQYKSNPKMDSKRQGPTILLKARQYLLKFFNPKNIPGLFGSVFGIAGNILIYILAVLFLGFFFLKEQGLFAKMIAIWVPNKHNNKVDRAIDDVSELLVRYFIGVSIQVTIITIYVSLLLSVFGIENGLMIGFLIGLINVIPYVGPMIGWVFGVVILLSASIDLSFYNEILPKIGILTGVIASMQLLDNLVLQPNIFSRSIKAHPVEIFIVILVAAKLGGILGMVLAIPIYTVFRVITRVFLGKFEILTNIAKGLNEE